MPKKTTPVWAWPISLDEAAKALIQTPPLPESQSKKAKARKRGPSKKKSAKR